MRGPKGQWRPAGVGPDRPDRPEKPNKFDKAEHAFNYLRIKGRSNQHYCIIPAPKYGMAISRKS